MNRDSSQDDPHPDPAAGAALPPSSPPGNAAAASSTPSPASPPANQAPAAASAASATHQSAQDASATAANHSVAVPAANSSIAVSPSPPFRLRATVSSRPIPLLTIKASEAEAAAASSPDHHQRTVSIRRELEQMEHAFLDLDDVSDPDDPSRDEWTFRGDNHPARLLSNLNDLRRRGVFCDVVIRAGERDREFPVHKCVLSAVSEYFRAMFTSSLCESTQDVVTLNGISPSVLELLFGYAYTAEVKITKNNVQNLLAAANLLGT